MMAYVHPTPSLAGHGRESNMQSVDYNSNALTVIHPVPTHL